MSLRRADDLLDLGWRAATFAWRAATEANLLENSLRPCREGALNPGSRGGGRHLVVHRNSQKQVRGRWNGLRSWAPSCFPPSTRSSTWSSSFFSLARRSSSPLLALLAAVLRPPVPDCRCRSTQPRGGQRRRVRTGDCPRPAREATRGHAGERGDAGRLAARPGTAGAVPLGEGLRFAACER